MKKLFITEKGKKIFNDWNIITQGFGKIGTFDDDYEIDYFNYNICHTSKFRKILHCIVDACDNIKNKDEMHEKISNKNFTDLLFLDILEMREIDDN